MSNALAARQSAPARRAALGAEELFLATVLSGRPAGDDLDDALDRRIVRRIVADLMHEALEPRAA